MRLVASLPAKAADMSASAEALRARFGPRPFSAMRRVRRVLAAKQPRAQAGVPVPSEMAASIAANRSLQGI
jgi:hypothetical protein